MRARLPISASRFSSPFAPAGDADHGDPPAGGERLEVLARGSARRRARGSRRTGRARRSPRARSPRRRARRPASRSPSSRTVAVTRAPAARASWIAAVPTPPAPPCTSSRSPGRSSACTKTASCAVVKTSGRPPAAGQSSTSRDRHQQALVHGRQLGLRAAADDRHHAVPHREALGPWRVRPSATTSPASSIPGMSCGSRAGAG